MREFKGKVAVITGGARGVGRALGALLASRGARVVLTDINPEKLDATVKELRLDGGDITGVAADVTSEPSVNALADKVFGQFGTIPTCCSTTPASAWATAARRCGPCR